MHIQIYEQAIIFLVEWGLEPKSKYYGTLKKIKNKKQKTPNYNPCNRIKDYIMHNYMKKKEYMNKVKILH
jgi:hypothetical protein